MTSTGTLYTYPKNFRAYKVLVAAELSGNQVTVDPTFEFGKTNHTDEFLKKFPLGKVPAYESSKGECIFESNAIAYTVSSEALRGKTPFAQGQVLMWTQFAESQLLPVVTQIVFPIMGLTPLNKKSNDEAMTSLKSCLSVLDSHLKKHTFFVDERISLADIVLACTLLRLYEHVMDPEFSGPFPSLNRWFDTIVNQPAFIKVVGPVTRCTKMGTFDIKVFKEMQAKLGLGGESKKSEKKEKAAPKAAAPKKEVKEEAPVVAIPKPKDPLDALPAGSFNMDDFKRFYSNNDEEQSVPYFWEKFDKENYSIWFGEYKFKEDLSKIFMTCNLVGGMFQRLEKLRKNAFASVCVFGEDGNNTISGVWVWRGHELAFPLSEDWQIDYESYEWRKLDAETDETKKTVDNYFKWVGEDSEGRKFNQGKIFK